MFVFCNVAATAVIYSDGHTVSLHDPLPVFGRYEAAGHVDGAPAARTLITGSHVDTVRDAGAYDGNLGVALPSACIAELDARGQRLPYAIEVIAFGDEEGVRFLTTLSGSRTAAGTFYPAVLAVTHAPGPPLHDAPTAFGRAHADLADQARTRAL